MNFFFKDVYEILKLVPVLLTSLNLTKLMVKFKMRK